MAKEHVSPVWSRTFPITISHGEGCYIYDTDGKRYLDFTSGIGVTNTGHCHPKVVAAAQAQVGKIIHAQVNNYYHLPLLELTDALLTIVPDKSFDCFFFTNSGAEAIEGAIKLARHATKKPNIITFQGGFHGRTNQTMATDTGSTIYRAGYAPLASGVFIAPFPYAYRYGWDPETTSQWCLKELRHLLYTQTAPSETAAVLIEPVQGEGGYIVPPVSFMKGLRALCDEFGLLLIADEVQSGFGRTGKFFAVEHFGITPDILVMAKGLASGFPLSGLMSRRELDGKMGSRQPRRHLRRQCCCLRRGGRHDRRHERRHRGERSQYGQGVDGWVEENPAEIPHHWRCARPGSDGRRRIHHAGWQPRFGYQQRGQEVLPGS